jgi:DNA (cytosine-5)-methyltransferase 1
MTFVSLFSGCGGFDLGFSSRGFQPVAAYDNDIDAAENFASNVRGPIELVDLTGGVPNHEVHTGVDAIISGPPCQGFSTAGKRLLHDKRNDLLPLTARLACRIWPKVLVVENVAGALAGEHARYWTEMENTMRLAGYRTHTIYCQATELGMAQLRKRILLFAWRTGRDISFEIAKLPASDLRTALSGVLSKPNHHPNRLRRGSLEWRIAQQIRPGQKLCNVRGGPNAVPTWDIPEVFGFVSENERTILELLRRLRRQSRRRRHGDADPVALPRLDAALGAPFRELVNGLVQKGYLRRIGEDIDLLGTFNGKFRRLAWHRPSCTVDTRFGSPRYFLHPTAQRGFSAREAARLQGFPDDFVFCGSDRSHFRLIGNAVPPPVGALAAEVTRRLLGRT